MSCLSFNKKCLVLLVTFLFASCATTKIATVNYRTGPVSPYSRVLITIPAFNYQGQQETEAKLKKMFEKNYNVVIFEANKLFPPVVELSSKEKIKNLIKNDIQAVVIVIQESGDSQKIAIDIPTSQQVTGYVGGQYVQLNVPTTSTYSYSVYTARHAIYIYDVERRKLVWYASTTTEGLDEDSMRYALVNKVMSALIKDNFVQKRKTIKRKST